jgi:poly-gamma-glutamate synthesis protein (capsule biosynthesis protein)
MLTRRTVLPVCGIIPFTRWPIEVIPLAKQTRILFGGDIMLSRFVGKLARERKDPAFPLRDIAPLLASADIAFANLESPFSDRGGPRDEGMVFHAAPEMIAGLEIAGIDVVSTANNHARDCGAYGVEYTVDWLEKHGIASVGTGRSHEAAHAGSVIERGGMKFGFLGYTFDQSNGNHTDVDERVAVMDIDGMRADVASILKRADVAIVSMHAGTEYAPRPNTQQTAFARAAIDAGASIVVGHHPHVVQSWERYRSGAIFYSLGNLVFDQFQRAETQRGAIAEVVFGGRALVRAGLIQVNIVRTAPRVARASGA